MKHPTASADLAGSANRHRAVWTNDCQGKKDYDGNFLAISCRFWPGDNDPGGPMVTLRTGDKVTDISDTIKKGPASAHASIMMLMPGDDYRDLRSARFKGADFKAVAADVENWVQANVDDIVRFVGNES